METTPIIDQDIFNQNLLLTQAYCAMQLINTGKSPAEILRSFNPEVDEKPIFSFGESKYNNFTWHTAVWAIDPLSDSTNGYQALFDKQLEHKRNVVTETEEQPAYKGRILVASIEETLWDGASESSSDGLVDINDYPPIDTWFYREIINGQQILFSWIPESYEQLAQGAIYVNCMDCLEWYEDWIKEPIILDNPRKAAYTMEPRSKYWIWIDNNRKFFNLEKLGYPWAILVRIIIVFILCALMAYFGMRW